MKKPRGLLYVGHLPKELDEVYLRKYFEQFGVVNCVHMPKSAKTGNYKGYGFVEFASVETAKIAAGAMDKYIIDGRILHVEYRETTRRLRVSPFSQREAEATRSPGGIGGRHTPKLVCVADRL